MYPILVKFEKIRRTDDDCEAFTLDGKYHRDSPMPVLFRKGTKITVVEPQPDVDNGVTQSGTDAAGDKKEK
jgi:hypothetical protein